MMPLFFGLLFILSTMLCVAPKFTLQVLTIFSALTLLIFWLALFVFNPALH